MMPVEYVISSTGRGTVATGRVKRGQIKVGEEFEIIGLTEQSSNTTVTGVEMFRKLLDSAEAGDNISTLLSGVAREDNNRRQVLAAPGSITPHTKFKAEDYVLSKDGRRRQMPFCSNDNRPYYISTPDVTGVVNLPGGTVMVMSGYIVEMDTELISPNAIEAATRFYTREG
ncbi:elongation factor Tu, partial [Staphylococcus felis]|uniref:EF-Tu/IF-2/RF-3 family GTPase n=1 Tax=Staphylococcus felis TaxID=46127 RepID=UPI000E3A725C